MAYSTWITKYFGAYTKTPEVKQAEISSLRETLREQREFIALHLKREFALLWLVNEVLDDISI